MQALYDFLLAVDAPGRMAARAAGYEEAGELQLADEYRQMWDILVGAMEEMAWVSGDSPMDAAQFASLFALVLGEYDIGSIPVSLDRVTCGAIDRVCGGGHFQHVILLGVNDGVLPKAPQSAGVLSDGDRLALDGLGIRLSVTGAERMLMEQEVIYKALACAHESLLLCCHLAGADGKECRPSYLLGAFRGKLAGLPVDVGAEIIGRDRLCADRPAVELACAALSGVHSPAARAALGYFADDERVRRARHAKTGRGPLASRETVEALYGKTPGLTASRVDLFYSCRFAFFMRHGLRAKQRKRADFAAPETGTFIHYVLENTLEELGTLEGGARAASEEQARRVMKKWVKTYVETFLGDLTRQTARFRYLFRRLTKMMGDILDNVLDELRNSDFAPIDYELKFGFDGDLPPVRCGQGEDAVLLTGTADRVDGYIQNGRLYVRVMDYKSGKKSFSLSDVWNGLNLQLILYLFAIGEQGLERYREKLAAELNAIEPAGVLYIPARDEALDLNLQLILYLFAIGEQGLERYREKLAAELNAIEPAGVLYIPARDEALDLEADEPDADKLRTLRDKALRRSGLVSDDLSLLEAMEHGLEGDGRFLPVKLKAAKPTKKNPDPTPELAAASAVADDLSLLEAMEHGLEGDGRFLPVKLKAAKPTKKNPDPTPELAAASAVADLERFGEAMEHGLEGDGRFLPVKLKAAKPTKKNPDPTPELAAASAVADLERFGRLARFAQGKLIEMGRELKKGSMDAAPCRHGQALHCDWCEFRAACRFDETMGDRVRSLAHLKDDEFWEAIEKGGDSHAKLD